MKTDEELLLPEEDDFDDLIRHNPLEDEEAVKESQFLEECMNILNTVKKTGDVTENEELAKKRMEMQKLLEE